MIKPINLLISVLLFTGCSNIGNRNTQHIYNTEVITVRENTTSKKSDCPKYVPLATYHAPELPLEKLRVAVDKGDHEVVLAMTKYVKELREHIAKRKKEEQHHYEQYLNSCIS